MQAAVNHSFDICKEIEEKKTDLYSLISNCTPPEDPEVFFTNISS